MGIGCCFSSNLPLERLRNRLIPYLLSLVGFDWFTKDSKMLLILRWLGFLSKPGVVVLSLYYSLFIV